ncbi:MAG: TfoX/Sxy family protein [Gemmatimonadales bacterium]
MAVSPEFRNFVVEQLSRVAPAIRARSMFGGVGVYSADRFFALIDGDHLYLKVDDSNRLSYEEIGMGPFRPFGPDGEQMQYYALPGDFLEDAEALTPWVADAIEVSVRAKAARAGRRRKGA